MCTPIIQDFSFQFQILRWSISPRTHYTLLHNLRVKIRETLHLHSVHFEEHLKTIWIPTLIPLLKIKVAGILLFSKSSLNSRTYIVCTVEEWKAKLHFSFLR